MNNKRKAEYVLSVAFAFDSVDESFLRESSYDEVFSWLTNIKGIGEWSASFILLRGLGRMEKVPLSEKRIIQSISNIYGTDKMKEIKEIVSKYGPWQGYWAHYIRAKNAF